jgi:hypothetical protein
MLMVLKSQCAFVDAAFGDRQLQLDCADAIPADRSTVQKNWEVLSKIWV